MYTRILNQWPDHGQALRDILRELIHDKRLELCNARFLVAYLSEGGLEEMKIVFKVLRERNGTLSAIIGFDPNQTTEKVLKGAIKIFTKDSLRVMGSANCNFHPKV